MVSFMGLMAALILPWALGFAILKVTWPRQVRSHFAMLIGYGYLLGILLTIVFIWVWDALGGGQAFWLQASILGLICLIVMRFGNERHKPVCWQIPMWQRVIWIFFVVLILARFFGIAQEVLLRPLYPWDAWWHYASKARIWSHWNELVPILHPTAWLHNENPVAYTLAAWSKPPGVSLIDYWIVAGLGRWDDVFVNLPWLLCALALGFGVYGQLRLVGCKPLASIISLYLLCSMPLINTHTALAGYADLWLATIYGFAVMSLVLWIHDRNPAQLILCLLFSLSASLIKTPGIYWGLLLLLILLLSEVSRRFLLWIAIILLAAAFLIMLVGGVDFEIPRLGRITITSSHMVLPYAGEYSLQYHDVWGSVAKNLFRYENWHLFWYLLFPVVLYALIYGQHKIVFISLLLMAVDVAFLYFVFFWTDKYLWALDSTTVNRATLHIVPAFIFLAMVFLQSKLFSSPDVRITAGKNSRMPVSHIA